MHSSRSFFAGLFAFYVATSVPAAAPVKPTEQGTLIVIDSNGKEQKLKTWKFTAGTRHLGWLAPLNEPKGSGSSKPDKGSKSSDADTPVGPEYIELREENSTNLVEGILTLVPLEQIRAMDFDDTDEIVKITVATSDKADDDIVLKGSTGYKNINKWTIESQVDKGELGVAEIKFLAGVAKGIKGIRFPSPKAPTAKDGGVSATITGTDQKKSEHKVKDVQALYALEGGQKLASTLFFKATLKVDLGKFQKVVAHESRAKGDMEWDVTLKDGDSNTLTLLAQEVTLDGKRAALLGLVGKVPFGYKIFGLPTIAEIAFETK
jgi:hypothetical protein